MNRILLSLFVVLTVSLVSCKDDEDDDKSSYSFKEQDLSGKIANESWTYKDGYASVDQLLYITITIEQDAEGCDMGQPEGDYVSFAVDKEEKVYALGTGSTSYSVTLFDQEEWMNYIALDGAVEITSITETEISGRIDARNDDGNFVNGNFTVPVCK